MIDKHAIDSACIRWNPIQISVFAPSNNNQIICEFGGIRTPHVEGFDCQSFKRYVSINGVGGVRLTTNLVVSGFGGCGYKSGKISAIKGAKRDSIDLGHRSH